MGAGAALLQRRSAELARSAPGSDGYVPPISSSRVERLLREREMRRVRSLTGLSLEQLGLEAEQPPVETADAPSPVPQMRTRDPSVENLAAMAEPEPRQRLLVVANRLPVSAKKRADGAWALEVSRERLCDDDARARACALLTLRIAAATSQISAGGLVSALLGIQQNYDICWIGWPGEKSKKNASRRLCISADCACALAAGVVVAPKEQPILTGAPCCARAALLRMRCDALCMR
jgi:trehalose 6-phosphate synthase/phosphatase